MRLRTGRELMVVDVSSGGVLVQGEARLLPGTHVDVHVITPAGRVLVRSRVMRAFVATLSRDRVEYRGALAFERQVDVSSGYAVPILTAAVAAAAGTSYPAEGQGVGTGRTNRGFTAALAIDSDGTLFGNPVVSGHVSAERTNADVG
jgi:hypothetical protein